VHKSIFVVVLTLNEAPNIARTLKPLGVFERVFVIDSGSTDATRTICAQFPNVEFVVHPFDRLDLQWNFGIAHAVAAIAKSVNGAKPCEWALTLDADYVLSDALIAEIATLQPAPETLGFAGAFEFWIDGAPVPASLYPPRTVLFRHAQSNHRMRGHAQDLVLSALPSQLGEAAVVGETPIQRLRGLIYHDDRKSWRRFLENQRKYAELEALHLLETPWRRLRLQDKVRLTGVIAPWLVPIATYARVWPAGKRAVKYCVMRLTAECGIAKTIWKKRFAGWLT
jgi:glycosyltransferase involved in cell wall biosynthesis